MNFGEIFNKAFLDGFSNTDIGFMEMAMVFALAVILGGYIYLVYRFVSRQAFYSKQFNVSLAILPVIVAAIILAIQSSIVISLGMVGALSIVRFRTAVKDPIDLTFLFWSISAGIICGAGLGELAVVASLVVTVMLLVLDRLQVVHAPMLLALNLAGLETEEGAVDTVRQYCRHYKVKSRNVTRGKLHMIVEVRTEKGKELLKALEEKEGILSMSLMDHDGEAVF